MNLKKKTAASFFAGAGGMDLGFRNAGFEILWANDFNKKLEATYSYNHDNEFIVGKIQDLDHTKIPKTDVIIGGPPCQSWSLAGAMRGSNDERGNLFFNYVELIKKLQPKAFVAENVKGIISKSHISEFHRIIECFEDAGYNVTYKLLNAKDFGVPQSRERVFIVGIRKDIERYYEFPKETHLNNYVTLRESIYDLRSNPGEFYIGSYSSMYMSRNRKKDWDDVSFTIQAGARHAPMHPDSSDMIKVAKDKRVFADENTYNRRLSVRECARIQTFPDTFEFISNSLADKYKMIGNAVPVLLAQRIAEKLIQILKDT